MVDDIAKQIGMLSICVGVDCLYFGFVSGNWISVGIFSPAVFHNGIHAWCWISDIMSGKPSR